jgi:serine/threonine-protein kinase
VRDYDLDSCQFAAPATVAANAITIEAFGTGGQPFEKMACDFEKDNGFEPDVQVRPILDPQCAAADFLKAVQPLTTPGPKLALAAGELPSGGSLSGTISDTSGWTTDLLLVDYRGGVQNVSLFMTPTSSGGATFALPPLTSKTAEAEPMMIIAIANKGGLNTTRLVRTHEAKQIFPVILQEIRSKGSEVAVSAKYFRLGGAQ